MPTVRWAVRRGGGARPTADRSCTRRCDCDGGRSAADFERSVEFQELRTQLQNCVRRRHFYQHVSNQLPQQNPKDTWVPSKLDGATPPFDPFMPDENVPGVGPCEVGAVRRGGMACMLPLTGGAAPVPSGAGSGLDFSHVPRRVLRLRGRQGR